MVVPGADPGNVAALSPAFGGSGTIAVVAGPGVFPDSRDFLSRGDVRGCGDFCARRRARPGKAGSVRTQTDRKDRAAELHTQRDRSPAGLLAAHGGKAVSGGA